MTCTVPMWFSTARRFGSATSARPGPTTRTDGRMVPKYGARRQKALEKAHRPPGTIDSLPNSVATSVMAATLSGNRYALGTDRCEPRHRYFLALAPLSSEDSAAMKASWGTSTRPTIFIRFLPSFCFSRSLRLRVMSPP